MKMVLIFCCHCLCGVKSDENVHRFVLDSEFFYWHTRWEMFSELAVEYDTPQLCCYTTLCNIAVSCLLPIIENS